jgi:hypothetical protein
MARFELCAVTARGFAVSLHASFHPSRAATIWFLGSAPRRAQRESFTSWFIRRAEQRTAETPCDASARSPSLKRAQEIHHVLLLRSGKVVEIVDHRVSLAALALVSLNRRI